MPIYEYRCSSCGHEKETLQKMSDPPLTVCPSCGQSTFSKLISAAGFQLKGSGWYVTDFKGGSKPAKTEDKNKAEEKKEGAATSEAKEKSAAKDDAGAKDGSKGKEQSTAEKSTGSAGSPAT